MEERLVLIQTVSAGAVILVGSLLHFTFAWFGRWKPWAVFAPINESYWEHLKLAYWPIVWLAPVERAWWEVAPPNFWIAQALEAVLAPIVILIVVYAYTLLTRRNILWVDIGSFVLAVLVAYQVGSWILLADPLPAKVQTVAGIAMFVLGLAMGLWTFFPPRCHLFRDLRMDAYGFEAEEMRRQARRNEVSQKP